jgi:hypothetical protein
VRSEGELVRTACENVCACASIKSFASNLTSVDVEASHDEVELVTVADVRLGVKNCAPGLGNVEKI